MVEEITTDKLQSLIERKEIVFVDFSAAWCGPCRELGKLIETEVMPKIMEDKNIAFVKIDIDKDENRKYIRNLGLTAVPVIYVWHKGEPVTFEKDEEPQKKGKRTRRKKQVQVALEGYRPDIAYVIDWVISHLRGVSA